MSEERWQWIEHDEGISLTMFPMINSKLRYYVYLVHYGYYVY